MHLAIAIVSVSLAVLGLRELLRRRDAQCPPIRVAENGVFSGCGRKAAVVWHHDGRLNVADTTINLMGYGIMLSFLALAFYAALAALAGLS